MAESPSLQEVSIIDKDETSDKAVNIVGGFVIEESTSAFPNSKLSFVPEDYGKKENNPQVSRTRPRPTGSSTSSQADTPLPPGMAKCEFCGIMGDVETFLLPSRRFCTVTCCKRFSAEKRYYPYGRDEEGVAFSIRQGLVNRHRSLRPNSKMKKTTSNARDDHRRRLAYFSSGQTGSNEGKPEGTPSTRGRRGRRPGSSAAPNLRRQTSEKSSNSLVEPYTHPQGTPLQQWTLEDVNEFLTHLGYEAYTDRFQEHEMDGRALCLMKDHHLLMTLKLRLGPTLKIIEHISVLKNMEGIQD